MVIERSEIANPVKNIRIVRSDFEQNYEDDIFNPLWIEKLSNFKAVRFMDWGSTNSWGMENSWEWEDTTRTNWIDRSQTDYYTWSNNKGIPYEIMIKLMNDYDLDGWVCVPHKASNEYIRKMAQLFHDNLKPELKLTVEYSNENWNWIFGQTQWLYHHGCEEQNKQWPEGIVPYIQNCLDIWSEVYADDMSRINRVVGVQTGWFDVSDRIIKNMREGSIDAVSPAYYFGLSDENLEAELDILGSEATVQDIASRVRESREYNEKVWIKKIKEGIADPLNLPLMFYEGGQHITPTPFGEEPTYADALLAIQRDTAIYNLYNEWFEFMRTLQSGDNPLTLMNFSFVSNRSAKYGSWGILETLDQDTSIIPAPKYKSIMENIHHGCIESSSVLTNDGNEILLYPNPVVDKLYIESSRNETDIEVIKIYNLSGNIIFESKISNSGSTIDLSHLETSVYIVKILLKNGESFYKKIIKY
ncbi:MAG: T9SS type A sorting domain-containing protein [Saprospiraceae bacterium]